MFPYAIFPVVRTVGRSRCVKHSVPIFLVCYGNRHFRHIHVCNSTYAFPARIQPGMEVCMVPFSSNSNNHVVAIRQTHNENGNEKIRSLHTAGAVVLYHAHLLWSLITTKMNLLRTHPFAYWCRLSLAQSGRSYLESWMTEQHTRVSKHNPTTTSSAPSPIHPTSIRTIALFAACLL